MEWKDLEKMTIVKLREEALKHQDQIKGVHGKSKPQIMDELAALLRIEKPHLHLAEEVVHSKGDLKQKIRELKTRRQELIEAGDHESLHSVRREIRELKRRIRKMELASAE